jgi:hypothetical protein
MSTVEPILGKLREALAAMRQSELWRQIVEPRDRVLARFQPLFAAGNVSALHATDFRPFLYFENNCHWTGLHRYVNSICSETPPLRQALAQLLDETRPVAERFDKVAGSIKGLGKGPSQRSCMSPARRSTVCGTAYQRPPS